MKLLRHSWLVLGVLLPGAALRADPPTPVVQGPIVVRFEEPRRGAAVAQAPVDPAVHIQFQQVGQMAFGLTVDPNIMLCCGAGAIRTSFALDNMVTFPPVGPGGALGPGPRGKRIGSSVTWSAQDVRITQEIEVVPSRPSRPGSKRELDTVLVRYIAENKSKSAHKLGVRVRIDTLCAGNDGALFAAPTTHPGKVLDGVELRGKTLPDYVQILQFPDLKNPGFVGHFTLHLGPRLIGPDRFVCTSHRAFDNGWSLGVNPAGGDSACALYWEPRDIPVGGKLEMGYAYGKGIVSSPDGEGRVELALSGSFAPGKRFTIAAHVEEPIANQTLALELPPGIELLEGRAVQPVPPPSRDDLSIVHWQARLRRLGNHALTVRSSTGGSETRSFTVESRPAP